jgi:hypothetical protein
VIRAAAGGADAAPRKSRHQRSGRNSVV